MVFWFLISVMTAVVIIVVARPLMAGGTATDDHDRSADQVEALRRQIADVDRDIAAGRLSRGEAEALRAELARRLLAADAEVRAGAREPRPAEAEAVDGPGGSRKAAARSVMAMAVFVPLFSLGVYLTVGSPDVPDHPHGARSADQRGTPVAEMIRRVEARLKEAPEDGQGWDVIAPVYMRLGRYRDAQEAYENAGRILGETSARLFGAGEAAVFAANGIVSADARARLARGLEIDPVYLPAELWLAVADEQDGKFDEAARRLRSLEGRTSAETQFGKAVRARLAEVQKRVSGGSVEARDPDNAPEEDADAPSARLGKLDSETRKQIEGMVAGLAERLQADSDDVDGWMRLVRSYMVLGQRDDALGALERGRGALSARADDRAQLDRLAQSLGLEPGQLSIRTE
ncbi:MAG: c-type cytochrome biogenesis protein CcmI [Pseudomonadota bacterium]